MLIVSNPTAGGFRRRLVESVAARLRQQGCEVALVFTTRPGETTGLVQSPAGHVDVVAVHGGDGTIAEAIAGLRVRRGARPALAVIPGGTANVLACELGLPFKARAIADMIRAGRNRPLYYALANGRPFFLMASAGFDAAVVHAVSPTIKRRLGKFAFVLSAISIIRREKTPDVMIETAEGVTRARLAVVANAACYGGPYRLAQSVSVDRAGLGLVVLPRDDVTGLLRVGWAMVARASVRGAGLVECQIGKVRLDAKRPVPVQVDGDAFGFTPVDIEPVAEPLTIITR